MKKTLVFAMLLTASLAAHAESMHVHLYRDFATTGTLLPAGDYTVSPATGNSGVMLMKGSTVTAFVFGRLVTSAPPSKQKISLELSKDKSFDLKSAPITLSLTR
jgi:hypothetical protein